MRVLKYVIIAALPILLFVNLWQYASQGSSFEYKGFKSLMDYSTSWHGFEYTFNFIVGLGDFIRSTYTFGGIVVVVLIGFAAMMAAPIMLFGTIIADIVANVIWFFGWIVI